MRARLTHFHPLPSLGMGEIKMSYKINLILTTRDPVIKKCSNQKDKFQYRQKETSRTLASTYNFRTYFIRVTKQ